MNGSFRTVGWVALGVEMKVNSDEWVSKSMDFKYS
jgi:hypothetical protein